MQTPQKQYIEHWNPHTVVAKLEKYLGLSTQFLDKQVQYFITHQESQAQWKTTWDNRFEKMVCSNMDSTLNRLSEWRAKAAAEKFGITPEQEYIPKDKS